MIYPSFNGEIMSREQFEAWWNLPPPCHNENTKLAAWEAWQAATANQDDLLSAKYTEGYKNGCANHRKGEK